MTQAFNPFLPSWEYVPDAEPRVFGDRVYAFGSHDRFGGGGFCLNDYVAWSAPVTDLAAWRNEGVIYRKDQDPLNPRGTQNLYAPDVVRGPDGRYYLYYSLNRKSITSVAVSDSPSGPYRFHGHVRTQAGRVYGSRRGDVHCFDPGVLIDGDRVFLYTGFAPDERLLRLMRLRGRRLDSAYCIELEHDMLTMKSEPVPVLPGPTLAAGTGFEDHAFFEASSPRRIGDRYYLVYSSIVSSELCYAVSDRPDGGFAFGGTVVDITDRGLDGAAAPVNYRGNTHGGLAEIAGRWYVFYHRHTDRSPFARQACAEPIEIEPDGSIAQVEVTSCGLNGGPLAGIGTYEARIAANLSNDDDAVRTSLIPKRTEARNPYFTQSGSDREGDGDQYIANLRDDTWAGFKYFDFSDGPAGRDRSVGVSVRGDASGVLEVSTSLDGPVLATIPITPSAGWDERRAPFVAPEGVSPLYVRFRGEGAVDFRELVLA